MSILGSRPDSWTGNRTVPGSEVDNNLKPNIMISTTKPDQLKFHMMEKYASICGKSPFIRIKTNICDGPDSVIYCAGTFYISPSSITDDDPAYTYKISSVITHFNLISEKEKRIFDKDPYAMMNNSGFPAEIKSVMNRISVVMLIDGYYIMVDDNLIVDIPVHMIKRELPKKGVRIDMYDEKVADFSRESVQMEISSKIGIIPRVSTSTLSTVITSITGYILDTFKEESHKIWLGSIA